MEFSWKKKPVLQVVNLIWEISPTRPPPIPPSQSPRTRLFTYSFDLRRTGSRGGGVFAASHGWIQIEAAAGYPSDRAAASEGGRACGDGGRGATPSRQGAATGNDGRRAADGAAFCGVPAVLWSLHPRHRARARGIYGHLHGLHGAGRVRRWQVRTIQITPYLCW